jgi:hypothetical protein
MATASGTRLLKSYTGEWDFAQDGGAASTIVLRSQDGPLPIGSIVLGGVLDVTVAALSATGTMAFSTGQTGADLLAATGQAGLTIGLKAIIPVFTAATMIKLTADRAPTVVIATAAFTAGTLRLRLVYL